MNSKLLIALMAISVTFALQVKDYKDVFTGKVKTNNTYQNFLSITRDMNQPKYCQASWAFATTSAMAAQFNFKLKNKHPVVVLSPQQLMNCSGQDITCEDESKVDFEKVLEHLKNEGVAEEGCNNYYANTDKDCSAVNRCKDCENNEDIHRKPICKPKRFQKYKLKDYGKITSTKDQPAEKYAEIFDKVYNELKTKGSLVCQLKYSDKIWDFNTSDFDTVFSDDGVRSFTSWVPVVGYKNVKDSDRLIIQTPFGHQVGYYGYIQVAFDKIAETENGILDNCYFVDVDPTLEWDENEDKDEPIKPYNILSSQKFVKEVIRQSSEFNQGLKLQSNLPGDEFLSYSELDDVPIDWRNVDGINYLTYVKNQHIPTYCGSCWAQAATSVMQDRVNIQRIKDENPFPEFNISVQAVIDCNLGGTCYGGDSSLLFEKAKSWPVPVETCRNYLAQNPEKFFCDTKQICQTFTNKGQKFFEKFASIGVESWARVRGVEQMKSALRSGPIVCDFEVTGDFVKYGYLKNKDKVQVYKEDKDYIQLNHAVSLVGWNVTDDGESYWIVRNSWGRYWGYDGFFYMKMGENTLGFESDCISVVPRLNL